MLKSIFLLSTTVALSAAHMQLYYPPPLKASNNPHTQKADNELLFPHNCCGKTTPMPCRGYLKLLGTPEGASVATWGAGSQQKFSLIGPAPYGGNHYGGSCQVGFSTDQGKTFRTASSWEGNCPLRTGGTDPSSQTFPFTVPSDLPSGDTVFAWTWMNREQEFFMNCAVVTISGGSGVASPAPATTGNTGNTTTTTPTSDVVQNKPADSTTSPDGSSASSASSQSGRGSRKCRWYNTRCRNRQNTERSEPMLDVTMKHKRSIGERAQRFVQRAESIAFNSRPLMLFADVNNGCLSPKTTAELKYPNPGPVVVEGDGEYPLRLPTGTCG